MWCGGDEQSGVNADSYIYRCCGEDMFNSYGEWASSGIILEGVGECCYLTITCAAMQ